MAKVDLDSSGLNSSCVINLNDSINTISKVINHFDYFDIPFDFSKRSELKNVESKLREVKKDLNNIKNWVVDSCNNYNTLINNLNNQANSLPTYQIKQRNNII